MGLIMKRMILIFLLCSNLAVANELQEALGPPREQTPIEQYINQWRIVGCTISSQIPVLRDWIGQFSIMTGFTCPVQVPNKTE